MENIVDRLNAVCTCAPGNGGSMSIVKDFNLRLLHFKCTDCLEGIVVDFDEEVTVVNKPS